MQFQHLIKLTALCNIFIFALNACQNTPHPTSHTLVPPSNTPSVQISATKTPPKLVSLAEIKPSRPWNIVVVIKDGHNFYQAQIKKSAEQAGKDFGVKVKVLDINCHTCAEKQIRAIADLIQKHNTDGLIVTPTDSVKLVRVVEKAIDSGIAVMAFDTPINSDRLLSFVDFDNFAAGKLAGVWLVQQLNGQGHVLILNGFLEQQNALERRSGFLAGLKQGKNMEVLDMQTANWDLKTAKSLTAKWLQQFPNIDAILAANDEMALGAMQAVVEAQRPGIRIVGFDGTSAALIAIQSGQLAATIPQEPKTQMRLSIEMMVHYLEKKEKFPSIVKILPSGIIVKENVQKYLSNQS